MYKQYSCRIETFAVRTDIYYKQLVILLDLGGSVHCFLQRFIYYRLALQCPQSTRQMITFN